VRARLDRWDEGGIVFHFGYDAMPNLVEIADDLALSQWKRLTRAPRSTVEPRCGLAVLNRAPSRSA